MIQRLFAILMLSLLFLGAGAAMAGPDQDAGMTLSVTLDDGGDELNGGEAGLEAPEAALAPRASPMPSGSACLPLEADCPVPAAPYLEGPQRPPRAA